jgi:pilus assembly protein Flp/PilA
MARKSTTLELLLSHLLDEEGQDLVEYALIIALIAFASVAGTGTVASSINSMINNVANAVSNNT